MVYGIVSEKKKLKQVEIVPLSVGLGETHSHGIGAIKGPECNVGLDGVLLV